MKYCLIPLMLCCGLVFGAEETDMNVDQLADFIRSELALKQRTDKQLAAYLKKIHLTEQLPDKTIQDLEVQGAGPKTVEALKTLEQQSASLKRPAHDATYSPETAPEASASTQPKMSLGAKGTPIPPPSSVRQSEILDEIKQYASTYTENLPNFICLQVTRRFIDPKGSDDYRLIDTVSAQLTYNQGHENYKVMSVNGKLMNVGLSLAEVTAKSGGAISSGEFGSLLRSVFD
ncbi:MAG: hypothetical protein JO061_11270, partial [Acidobacteriaceae bacterium]|nr:hypothetical protein [Acidobacteriaceae bacterium]